MNSYHHDWMEPLPSETPPPAPEPVVRRRKQKNSNGNVLVHHEQGSNMDKVRAYTYALAVPVKAYSAEDDFLENYGSYDTVISKIDDLNKDVSKLTSDLDAKTKEYDALKEKADQLQKDKTN